MAATLAEKSTIESVLSKSCFASIHTLLGPIIRERLSAKIHGCNLIRLLGQDNQQILALWEQPCGLYLRAVQCVPDAVAKIILELSGSAKRRSPAEFDARVSDFFAEIAVVAGLYKKGVHDFVPLSPPHKKKKETSSAPDYSCVLPADELESHCKPTHEIAYLEVKNLRAPIGITAAFARAYGRLSSSKPELSRFRIVLRHYWDNTATDEQAEAIDEFLMAFADRPVPQCTALPLPGGVEVEIRAIEGTGGVSMIRPVGGDYPWGPYTNEEKFFEKATSTIRQGITQFSNYPDATHILALNVQSPDAMFPSDYGLRLQEIVERESSGTVHCLLFHLNHFVEP
jgi:hypothetical protein